MKVFWALNRATSRCSKEEVFQRRDVRGNVATFQRIVISNVATLDINVATFQRGAKINVATFEATSRRSRECQIQRRDVYNQHHDVPEEG